MTVTSNESASARSVPWGDIAATLVPIVGCAALAYLPWIVSFSTQRLAVEILTVFTIALSWNLLAGYGGLIVVGQHMFVGVGAYTLFAASDKLGLNPWLALPLAALASALYALLSAAPLFRLSGAYFAVGTWVVAEMLRIIVLNNEWLGAGGGMPLEAMSEISRWMRNAGVYWSALGLGLAAFLTARFMLRGRLGLALMSVRDSEAAAAACGIAVGRAKLALWLIAGTLTGLAGSVAYMSTLQVTPDASFSLNWTAAAIFIAVLGGIGTLEGPVLGAIIYFVLREAFSSYGAWYFIGLGLLAILTMVYAPGGAWSLITRRRSIDLFKIRRRMPPISPTTSTAS
jgi:branched-chain amino acid transport system permease protein